MRYFILYRVPQVTIQFHFLSQLVTMPEFLRARDSKSLRNSG